MNLPLSLTLIFFAGPTFAAKPTLNFQDPTAFALQTCEAKATTSPRKVEFKGSISALPKGILVAREARFSVESRSVEGSLVRVESFQSFVVSKDSKLKSKPKVVCASSELPFKSRFSMMGPTLINVGGASTAEKNIFWQFQVLADSTLLSPWNIKSLAMSASGDLEKTLSSLGYTTKIYPMKSRQYEIVYSQKTMNQNQTLSIVYDFE